MIYQNLSAAMPQVYGTNLYNVLAKKRLTTAAMDTENHSNVVECLSSKTVWSEIRMLFTLECQWVQDETHMVSVIFFNKSLVLEANTHRHLLSIFGWFGLFPSTYSLFTLVLTLCIYLYLVRIRILEFWPLNSDLN
jgi:hypothetical protein